MVNFPEHAPFDDAQKQKIEDLASTLTPEQTTWLSGYFAGTSMTVATAPVSQRSINVLYGTESGNCEELAVDLMKTAKKSGFKAQITNMAETNVAALKEAETLLVVVSTWGEGEPPETAETFYNELMSTDLSLAGLEFAVCALGDTSYEQFCQTGKDVDARLEKLGAKRITERVDCDVDYDESYAGWNKNVWSILGSAEVGKVADVIVPEQIYDRKNPFPAEVISNQLLSGDHSNKETIHVELSLDGSGFEYLPGDVLAVLPNNAKDVVDSVLAATGLAANTRIEVKNVGKTSLGDALTSLVDITALSRKIVNLWQEICGSEELAALLKDTAKSEFKEWSEGRQIIDLLENYPAESITAQQFIDILRKLPPRLYSIASSPKAHPGEVHLTVAAVRYDIHGRSRKGVASTYLADDALKGSKVLVYVHPNKNFRLPENDNTSVIMVGPGTGIAPFRAFIEDRAETECAGEIWLFFGDQNYNEDFLYQTELQDYLKEGYLSRLDVAFSRDQPEKIYVQHKMLENASEIWRWLETGAHFYVCGDASRMAKDVHDTLLRIIETQGDMNADDAAAYLTALKKDKRYQRDVY
ncbi:MAG TPA: sulfite reductase [NADPH] flavoprotein alpha-component [Verrucomicrobiales bacterium]|nr:sulfite reductase [NADPH] flavoprotein alpha-component [Verrucomicrobiales bacterium]